MTIPTGQNPIPVYVSNATPVGGNPVPVFVTNPTANPVPLDSGGTGADDAYDARANLGVSAARFFEDTLLSTRLETTPRLLAVNAGALATAQALLGYFTPDRDFTVSNLITHCRVAQTAATLAKMGLYSVDGSGNLTCIARSANDTNLWVAPSTVYTKAVADNGQGQAATSVALTRGQRYVFAALVITGGTLPQLSSIALGSGAFTGLSPVLARLSPGSQTDLAASYAVGTLATTGTIVWGAMT